MEIAAARVASIHYTLTDDAGQVLDKSPESQPLRYLHGAGNIIPGLEKALVGKQAGDKLKVEVAPEEGYGARNQGLVQVLPATAFKGVEQVEPGMQFTAQGARGPMLITVVAVDGDQVTIDGNHPMAGKTLHFDVEVADVRAASEEEQQSGRVAAA